MFEDDPNTLEEEAKDASSDSPAETAEADSQVSDITTESSETQAEAETEGDGAEGAEAAEATAGEEASEEPSAKKEGTEDAPVAAEPKRNPLLDYEAPNYSSVEEAIDDQIEQTSRSLSVNEDLMMSYIHRNDVHTSYYELWLGDANLYFRSLCIYRKRLQKLKEREAAAQAEKDEAKEDPTPKKEATDAAV